MANILELLTAPGLEAVRPLVGPLDAVEVTGIRLEPRPDRLAAIPAGTVAVLLAPVPGHLLDVAVRDAAAAGAAALVLTGVAEAPHGLPAEVTATARALAERGRVAVLYAEGTSRPSWWRWSGRWPGPRRTRWPGSRPRRGR
ncbi:hypothetical protein ACFQ2K_41375 [Streptomyces sanglieri]|uniref:Uncharacterized protein n=1 Tax=Streptomyces sanglieri TaxID=193460 RepID=A0ABW2X5I2_9ACTN